MRWSIRLRTIALGAALLATCATAVADIREWGTGASAGVVAESDRALVAQSAFSVSFKGAKAGSITIRYPMPKMNTITGGKMQITFKDAGANDRVVASVKAMDMSGVVTTMFSFDSDDLSPSSVVQTQEVTTCDTVFIDDHRFLFEVTLTRTLGTGSKPAIHGFAVDSNNSCP